MYKANNEGPKRRNSRGGFSGVLTFVFFSFFFNIPVQGDQIIFSVRGSLEADLAFSQEGFVSRLYLGTQENLVKQQ